jgi:rare lipoprotein A (peptidoglycan hydrolase)
LSIAFRRVWLLVNIVVTVALLPALFPDHDGGSGTAVAAGAGAAVTRSIVFAVDSTPSTMVVPTTTTTIPPTTAAPATTTAKKVAPATTTTAKPRPKPTTTTAAPRTVTTPAPPATPAASGSESGRATWYDYQPGICAHKTLPFGTVVTVHAVNGKSVQCTVGDRGPYVDGYVIDLHWREFEQLTSRDDGRIDVTITW